MKLASISRFIFAHFPFLLIYSRFLKSQLHLEWQFDPENCSIREAGRAREAAEFEFIGRDWNKQKRVETHKGIISINEQRPRETGKLTTISICGYYNVGWLIVYCSIFSIQKKVNDLKRQSEEQAERLGKQNDELQRLNAKLKDATLINKQLNDELNEKTEQICHLHSENSR